MVNLIGLFLASLFFFAALSAFSQDARLIQAAKKEGGKVVVYGSLEADTVEAIRKAFQKKTGIEMDYWRASATKVMDRALSESCLYGCFSKIQHVVYWRATAVVSSKPG